MTTDNKTLADAQPGGRVRLGDQPTIENRARELLAAELHKDFGPASAQYVLDGNDDGCTAMRAIIAALSAQPSPGGQGDALLESLVARWRKDADEVGISDNTLCQKIANCTMRHAAELQAVLAARQPVGEPIGWFTEDHLTDRSATTYDRTIADRWRAKGWPVSPLYAAPPAQAVDLVPVRMCADEAVEFINHGYGGHARRKIQELLALLDSQAVGK
ncbi:TPA: hypothetical protein ACXJST_000330 [Stenotrophomonas maltophilia]